MFNLLRVLAISIACFSACSIIRAKADSTLVSCTCNDDSFPQDGPFSRSLNFVLGDVAVMTPERYDYYDQSPWPAETAYGHGACNSAVTYYTCEDCITTAYYEVINRCVMKYGGQVQLTDCRIRYESYPFTE